MKLKHDHNDKYIEEHCADCIIQKAMSIMGKSTRDKKLAIDPDYYRKIQAIGVKNRNAKKGIVRKQEKVLTTVVK